MPLQRLQFRTRLHVDPTGQVRRGRLRKWPRRLAWMAGGLLGLLLLLAAWGTWEVRRQVPDFSAPPIPGLKAPVKVRFDARGVATVQAGSLRDALRVQGYLMARERMFQMDLQRRAAEGELAAFAGPSALPFDRLHRIYGFRQVAEAAVPRLPAEEREALEALAAGINAFIASHEGRWGLEFRLLGLRPKPWTPAHSLEALLLMHEDMSTSWRDELQAEKLAALPRPVRAFLRSEVAEGDEPLVPDGPGTRVSWEELFSERASGYGLRASGEKQDAAFGPAPFPLRAGGPGNPAIPHTTAPPEARGPKPEASEASGSNNWALSPRLAAGGQAMLANDPHLGLQAPGLWFPIRLEFPGGFLQGVALPGLPGVVIGQNESVAWGFTNLGSDVQDLVREPEVRARHERIQVKGQDPVDLVVRVGEHGPQVETGLSLAWMALDPGRLRLPLALARAHDWVSFNAALDGFDGPAMNVVYADRHGHIGWRATGALPLRAPGDDGTLPREAARAWRGVWPSARMPRVLDPPEGFVATANHRVIGTSFPIPVTARWASPSRVRRVREQLARMKEVDRATFEGLQRDGVSVAHRELMAAALPFLPEAWKSRFEGWDGDAAADSLAFTQAAAYKTTLRKALLARLLNGTGLDPETFVWWNDDAPLAGALKAPPEAWSRAGLGDKAEVLAQVAKEAEKAAGKEAWGQRNRLRLHHPLGRGGGILSWIFDPPQAPQSGSLRSIRVAGPAFGQSMRMIVDWRDPEGMTLVLPLGVSGHLGSPHRMDQQTHWLKGDPEGRATRMVQPGVGRGMVFGAPGS